MERGSESVEKIGVVEIYGVLYNKQYDEEAQHFYRKLGYKDCGGFVIDISEYEQPMEMFLLKGI